jgi:hypothetical protein
MKRFWSKTKRNERTGCLEWTGASNGYGRFRYLGQTYYAHRFAWELYKGRESTKFICHKCDNPLCIEESHLFEGSGWDNSQDAATKGRMGRKNILDWHTRNLIRLTLADKRLLQKDIASIFGTSQATVHECKFFLHEPRQ